MSMIRLEDCSEMLLYYHTLTMHIHCGVLS